MANPKGKFRIVKKILLWFFGSLAAIILILLLLAFIFKDKLKEMALRELGNRLNAKIEVSSSSVSFISSFPTISITLNDLRINPKEQTEKRDIIYAKSAVFKIDFWSLFSSRYKLSGIALYNPAFWIEQHPSGKWNYGDLFQPQPKAGEAESGEETIIELSQVWVEGGVIDYRSLPSGTETKIDSLQISLSGEVSGDNSDLATELDFHLKKFTAGSVPVLSQRHVHSNLKIFADYAGKTLYRLDSSRITIAGVELGLDGKIEKQGEDYNVDLTYTSRKNSFESFISLLPGNFLDLGVKYKHSGMFVMAGWIKGPAGSGKAPDFFAEYSVSNGFLQYEGYKGKLNKLNLNGSWLINNKVPALSHFRVESLRGLLNDHAIEGNIEYKNFLEPRLALELHGELTLEDIRGFYPTFADSVDMKGTVLADLSASGLMEDFRNNKYKSILADGTLELNGVSIRHPDLFRKIESLNGLLNVDNGQIRVKELTGKIGKTDFDIHGTITEYLPYLLDSAGLLTAKFKLVSDNLDLNEWFRESPKPVATGSGAAASTTYSLSLPDGIDFNIDATVGAFTLDKFRSEKLKADCRVFRQKLEIRNLSMNAMSGEFDVKGKIELVAGNKAKFDLFARTESIDINQTFKTFDQLAAFALVKDNLTGNFTGNIELRGEVNEKLELIPSTLYSSGKVTLENGRLQDFEPLEAMAGFIKVEKLRDVHFSTVTTEYKIENERFFIPGKMKVNANDYKLTITGSHGFDYTLDYHVDVELPRKEAQASRNSDVQNLVVEAEEKQGRITIPIWITGTVDNPKFKLDLKNVGGKVSEKITEQGEELKQGANQEIEKTFGKQDTLKVDDLIREEPKDTSKVKAKDILNKLKGPFKGKGNK